jgi:hypothetical protein
MAARDPLPHFGRIDFLAIVVPGFYLLANFWLVVLALNHPDGESLWTAVQEAVRAPTENWTVFLGIILASYLLGSLVRAIPVNHADELWRVLGWLAGYLPPATRTEWSKIDWFPYREVLQETLSHVEKCRAVGVADPDRACLRNVVSGDGKQLHTAYNYWKVAICDTAPGAFEFTQELESRVRLFAGMFWAGGLGAVLLVGGFLVTAARGFGIDWGFVAVFGVSLLIAAAFGANIGRVRREEVRYVFLTYLVYLLGGQSPGAGSTPPPHP